MKTSLLLFIIMIASVRSYTSPSACTSTSQFYNPVTLSCESCPANTNQAKDFTYCNCTTSFYPDPSVIGFASNSSCQSLGGTYTPTNQIASIYDLTGAVNPSVVTCSNSYPNAQNDRCIPCGPDMILSPTLLVCVCSGSNQYAINGFCYANTSAVVQQIPISNIADYLAQQEAIVGCGMYRLYQSCNLLINKCVQNDYLATNRFCRLLNTLQTSINPANGLPVYSFSSAITDSIGIYASSISGTNSSTVKNTLNFVLFQYNPDGSLNDIKSLDDSIMPCYLNNQDIVDFMSFGNNFYKSCSNRKVITKTYFYDIYVVNQKGQYAQVPVKIGTPASFYKRFMPSNAYSRIVVSLVTQPPLLTPYFELLKTTGEGIVQTTIESSSYTITYAPFLAIFLVFMLVFFIIYFVKYIRYNPDQTNDPYYCFTVIAYVFIELIKFIAMTIFLWLFCFSAYCFCFYKFQQTVFLLLPSPEKDSTGLYKIYQALFYTGFSLLILALLKTVITMVRTTDYFLIDWEKQKQLSKFEIGNNKREISVWRQVLLVNELYELSISRLINLQSVCLFSLLFLSGLDWINLDKMFPNTNAYSPDHPSVRSQYLSHFIISFVILTIAVVQLLIRLFLKIWFPLPIQNFTDLCSVSNISIIIFDQQLHGYYIHGMNPLGQSQGSLAYIQAMFQKQAKAFGKSRSFKLQDVDHCQTFEVIFPLDIRQAFKVKYKAPVHKVITSKEFTGSLLSNPIPQGLDEQDYKSIEQISGGMLESFKYYLQGVKTSQMNVRERGFCSKLLSCPGQGDLTGKLPVFFKDYWYEFSNVMLSGHQMLLLFYFTNWVIIFHIATKNIVFAFLIAFVLQKITETIIHFFIRRNISKNTLIDDKFFN